MFDRERQLVVPLRGSRGVIPYRETALGAAEWLRDIAIISRVGRPVCFTVVGFANDGSAVLSRRAVQQRCRENYIEKLSPGDVVSGRITRVEPFGCFVDIGCGITCLLPLEYISVARIDHPSRRFAADDDIIAVVRSFDERGRIVLTHRELLGTWQQNAAVFCTGDTAVGTVRCIEEYGAFIELAPNLCGLCEPTAGLELNDRVRVHIKNINPEKMKVKLAVVEKLPPFSAASPVKYYITGGHIDYFCYSPPECGRIVATIFNDR